MTRYSKLNFIYKLQKWMDSVPGQTFLNYAYSWGASIVILGTLFKLTHLPGANFFLYLGMGTEVIVFFLSAFDRPFDKTADGMELDLHPGMAVGSATVVNGEPLPEDPPKSHPWRAVSVLLAVPSLVAVAQSLSLVVAASSVVVSGSVVNLVGS